MRFILMMTALFYCMSCSKRDTSLLLQEVRREFHKELAHEYGVHLVEERLQGKGKGKRIIIDYAVYEEGDVLRARLLIHRIAETLLAKTATVENKYRVKEKLKEKNVEITISFVDPKPKKQHLFIGVTHVSLLEGWIHYSRSRPHTGEIELMHREEFTTLLAPLVEI